MQKIGNVRPKKSLMHYYFSLGCEKEGGCQYVKREQKAEMPHFVPIHFATSTQYYYKKGEEETERNKSQILDQQAKGEIMRLGAQIALEYS